MVGVSPCDSLTEDTPGYIPQAFPKLFPFGTGDYHDPRGGLVGRPNFDAWGRYVLQWHDGRFMRHTRFRYWFLDTWLHMKTPGLHGLFLRMHQEAQNLTLEDLTSKERRRKVVQQMSTASSNIPGSIGERRRMRQELEAMVDQKEAETADCEENGGAGRLPAGFCTLTCSVYKWEQLFSTVLKSYPPDARAQYTEWKDVSPGPAREEKMRECFYKLAVANPGAVTWYCALKLEMSVYLVMALLTRQLQGDCVPGRTACMETLQQTMDDELRGRGGDGIQVVELDCLGWGRVDDFWSSFEWSAGGMVHGHIAYWIKGAPRIDKVVVPDAITGSVDDTVLDFDGQVSLEQGLAAERLASFFDRAYTEYNISKPPPPRAGGFASDANASEASVVWRAGRRSLMGKKKERQQRAPDMISEETLLGILLKRICRSVNESHWAELDEILLGSAEHPGPLAEFWREAKDPDLTFEHKAARARRAFVGTLVDWMQLHDFHAPFPSGPPSKGQSCAKVENEHSCQEKTYCGKMFPRTGFGRSCGGSAPFESCTVCGSHAIAPS